jgi:2,3-bisphosphoglycerate-independent phosphoglycerate mutase
MKVLFIFLDGVGLGENNPEINPLARVKMPNLHRLLGGRSMIAETAEFVGERASLLSLDATMQVEGIPQSASGQATLVTGHNVPLKAGEHYGPKPNPVIAEIIKEGNIFKTLSATGKKCALLNAYPPRYFEAIGRGKRLYSAIPLAVTSAGLPLFTEDDFFAGQAMSADFTGAGWRTMLGYSDSPVLSPHNAGRKMAELAIQYDFSLFEYWASDYAGHGQDMEKALELLETLDAMLGGLLENMGDDLLVLVTSDHGNIEDLSTRRHTLNPVPGLLIGSRTARERFGAGLMDLTGVSGKINEEVTNHR